MGAMVLVGGTGAASLRAGDPTGPTSATPSTIAAADRLGMNELNLTGKRILIASSLVERRKSERGQVWCNQVKSVDELRHHASFSSERSLIPVSFRPAGAQCSLNSSSDKSFILPVDRARKRA